MSARCIALALLLVAAGCQSTASELSGLRATPPLDYAVLVTGGAFLAAEGPRGTFTNADGEAEEAGASDEPIGTDEVLAILREGRVFQRVAVDPDATRRRQVRNQLAAGAAAGPFEGLLQQARDDGFDFLLVIEELQDGPIESQGINARWPVTFTTWILLGVGALIPDHTFESRATLRVSIRDLQTGRRMHDPLLTAGPVELALTERTDVLGLLASILVPPFWVGDDADVVRSSVRGVTRRRLLERLARDLKSVSVRQRLWDGSAAAITLDAGETLVVDAAESLSSVRLHIEPPLSEAASRRFAADLLASMQNAGGRFRYRAQLPAEARGRVIQVLVATIRAAVASATLAPGGGS